VTLIGNRANSTSSLEEIEEIVVDGELAERVGETMKASMGQEISDFDIECLQDLCKKTLRMF